MQDYFQEQEYFIENIWFYHDGCRHSGNGIMIWNPANGFRILARMKRSKPLPSRKDITSISIDRSSLIRMKLDGGLRAIVPNISLDEMALIHGQISLDAHRLIFIQAMGKEWNSPYWHGSAIYETKSNLLLPDIVSQETKIGAGQPSQSSTLSGLHYEDGTGQRVVGRLVDKKYLEVSWSLPKLAWLKADNWHFATGLRDAISIVAGEAVQLCYHQSYRHGRIYTEMRLGEKPFSLGILFRPLDWEILDKNNIIQLTNFLAQDSKESGICRKIFYQMADASRQKSWQAKELLLSTILEAALRTLYNHPFAPDKNQRTDSFNVERMLKEFCEQYLSDTVEVGRRWKKAMSKVVEVHKRLRHRNAHPDWSSGLGGGYSSEEMEHTINDVIFLSRSYGYMILALAGSKKLEPIFPKPFTDWRPMITITRTEKGDHDDIL